MRRRRPGLSLSTFSINWPTKSAVTPPANNPWPTLAGDDYGSARTWGSVVDWVGIEPAMECDPTKIEDPCWQWTELDSFLSRARAVHFVPANYPTWANKATGAGANAKLPTDVSGTGDCANLPQDFRTAAKLAPGDCMFQELMFAVAMHTCTGCGPAATGPWQGTLAIRSFSSGNEINGAEFVSPPCKANSTASCAALGRMSEDLYKIVKYVDSTVTVGTPSFTQVLGHVDMRAYLELDTHPGQFADAMVFHIYGQGLANGADFYKNAGMPEVNWGSRIANYAALLDDAHHMTGKPMWVDEGGWGENFQTNLAGEKCGATDCGCATAPVAACMTADSLTNTSVLGMTVAPAPGFLVRGYVQMIAAGVDRFYWYGPGADEWGSWATYETPSFVPMATATAWHSMVRWLVGTHAGTLANANTQWTYSITGKTGTRGCSSEAAGADYAAVIAWDTNAATTISCGNATHYCTLFENAAPPFGDGMEHACAGSVALGPNPILLEP